MPRAGDPPGEGAPLRRRGGVRLVRDRRHRQPAAPFLRPDDGGL